MIYNPNLEQCRTRHISSYVDVKTDGELILLIIKSSTENKKIILRIEELNKIANLVSAVNNSKARLKD
jgi:hypothetical protein